MSGPRLQIHFQLAEENCFSLRAQTGIISNATFNDILMNCNFSDVGPFVESELTRWQVDYCGRHILSGLKGDATLPGVDCSSAVSRANQEMGNINLYDIYSEACLGSVEDGHHFGHGSLSFARK